MNAQATAVVLAAILIGGSCARAEDIVLRLDCRQPTGTLKGLHSHYSGGFSVLAQTDLLAPKLREIGAGIYRLPIFRPPTCFKGTTLADAENPAMYDFREIDLFAGKVQALGLQMVGTIAGMPPQLAIDGQPKGPPKDPQVFAEVVKHVVLHLTAGWAGGQRYPIRYWEVWNEPDNGDSPAMRQAFWTGTRQQYCELYAAVARAIHELPPPPGQGAFRVGGPALAYLKTWAEPFLAYCHEKRLPLGFFSFHAYADDPQQIADVVHSAAVLVRKYPEFQQTELVLNEWNMKVGPWGQIPLGLKGMDAVFYAICNPKFAEPQAALHMARTLMLLERSELSMGGHFLLTDNGVSTMGLITCPEIPVPPASSLLLQGRTVPKQQQPRLAFYVAKAFAGLSQTPRLVAVQIQGEKVDALAGLSAEQDQLAAVIVNSGAARLAEIQLSGFSAAGGSWEGFLVDQPTYAAGKAFTKLDGGQLDKDRLTARLPADSVVMLRVIGALNRSAPVEATRTNR
jgi:hypothetical protein